MMGPRVFIIASTVITVTVDYPSPDGTAVLGNGFLCAWGTVSDNVTITAAKILLNSTSYPGTAITNPSPCKWAFSFTDVTPSTSTATLQVSGTTSEGPFTDLSVATFTVGAHASSYLSGR